MADDAEAVLQRATIRRARRRFAQLAGGWLAAAAAVILLMYVGWWRAPVPPAGFQVLASTSREVKLPDGSIAVLNGASRIETDYTATQRRVRLVDGEAHFLVTRDAGRPFVVVAGPVTVRAVGTAFNVRLDPGVVDVLVTEGKVQVSDNAQGGSLLPALTEGARAVGGAAEGGPVLIAGYRARVNLGGTSEGLSPAHVAVVDAQDIRQALAWQSTRLVFSETPLGEVVDAFNRYNARQLTLGDPELRHRRISGVFLADNLDGFIRLMKAGLDIRTEQVGKDETILLPNR
ncbi:MAG: FecR domain-containing protein [Opitutaceae bacterium]|nr:FecR domain-containing protein [Opitutaceae bacterium]